MKIVSKHPIFVGTAILALSVAGLYGCTDFLTKNEVPQGTLDQSTLANQAGVEGSLIATYRELDCSNSTQGAGWGCAASNWVWGSVAGDDSYKGSDATDQPPINDIEGYHWSGPDGQSYINEKWQISYEGIARANATLRLLKQVVKANAGAITAADQAGIAGEAIFLRAHYHFEAWRMWGNIPYYREDDVDFRKPNLTVAQVTTELLKDLDSASKLLPATPRNGDKGRVSKWTALAYKGRVLVYSGQYAAAIPVLQNVKTAGPYGLETSFDRVWTGFGSAQDGPETILAYQASANDGEPNGENANYGERLNFAYSGSHFGCCGFNQPTQNLVNFFKVDGAGLPIALTSSPSNNPYDPAGTWNTSNAIFNASATDPVDPRIDWTVGRDQVPYKDWGVVNQATWVRDVSNGGPYTPKKNAHEKASGAESATGWQPTQLNSVHIHLYRYADLLLMLAEADVEAGGAAGMTEALGIVNSIRTRASQKVQGCGDASVAAIYPSCVGHTELAVKMGDPTISWAQYQIGLYPAFPSQAYAREAVRAERRIELALEGQRLYDLRRWGGAYGATASAYAKNAINGFIGGEGGGMEKARRPFLLAAAAFADKHLLFPIPDLQIQLSKVNGTSTLKQNTGW
ncbi:MAG TPA: RagB/SusD family nutrient uptake outer membrane protein [Gemmatimonadaceae bacterium]|nr:RagB/SusD family nutrient uptake outer membrane protein [Gemmatimonadaceae bacterium]